VRLARLLLQRSSGLQFQGIACLRASSALELATGDALELAEGVGYTEERGWVCGVAG